MSKRDWIEEAVDRVLGIRSPHMLRVREGDQETGLGPLDEAVRPAWVTVVADGVQRCATGPGGREGEMGISLQVRNRGQIEQCLNVFVNADRETTEVQVVGPDNNVIWSETYEQ